MITGFEFNEILFSPFMKIIYFKIFGYEKNPIISQSADEDFDQTK